MTDGAATVRLLVHMAAAGLSGADRAHALLELALTAPHGHHRHSARTIGALTGVGRVAAQRRRRRLRAAGIIATEPRPGRASTTRPGPVARLLAARTRAGPGTSEAAGA